MQKRSQSLGVSFSKDTLKANKYLFSIFKLPFLCRYRNLEDEFETYHFHTFDEFPKILNQNINAS